MAMQHHPLSNGKLGAFDRSYTRKKDKGGLVTVFMYENGIVLLNNDWKWQTIMDDDDSFNEMLKHENAAPLFSFSDKSLDKINAALDDL